LGGDSNGPLLVTWWPTADNNAFRQTKYSFLDATTLKVLKSGWMTTGGFQGIGAVSPSGGSFTLHPMLTEPVNVRASANGLLFAMWHTHGSPNGFQTLSVRHDGSLRAIYNHEGLGHLAPGPDGMTVYTGSGSCLNAEGKMARESDPRPAPQAPGPSIPSFDPAFYLRVHGLRDKRSQNNEPFSISAAIHAAENGSRLFAVDGLDEMKDLDLDETFLKHGFTIEKRFHLIPAAQLLITIPPANDRLVLRRLDVDSALEQAEYPGLIVGTSTNLNVEAGCELHHQIEARSRGKTLHFDLAKGPAGLTLSPTGALDWKLPTDLPNDVEEVLVNIGDSLGRKRSHAIKIQIR
jgi:hypothetical protein